MKTNKLNRDRKHASRLLLLTSVMAITGLGLVFFDNSTSLSTFAQQGQSCANLAGWTPGSTPDGGSVTGYKFTGATYSETCAQLSKKLICNDGSFNLADANTYKQQTCTDQTRANCTTPTSADHLQYKTLYKFPQATQTETCTQLSKSLQCINDSFSGINANLYQAATCQDQNRLPCINIRTNTYFDHLDITQGYSLSVGTPTQSCNSLQVQLKCMNGQRSGSNGQRYTSGTQNTLSSGCINTGVAGGGVIGCQFTGGNGNTVTLLNGQSMGGYASSSVPFGQTCTSGTISCNNGFINGAQYIYPSCTIGGGSGCYEPWTGGGYIGNGGTSVGYSTIMRAITGQNYSGTCAQYAGTLSCNNGVLAGASTYRYSQAEACNATAKNCVGQRQGGTIYHGAPTTTGRSVLTGAYPHTCDDYAAVLSCTNGLLKGNYATYKYPGCTTVGWPTQQVDLILSVNGSAELQSATITGGFLSGITYGYTEVRVAQFSSPKLNIAITNRGTSAISGTLAEGFLQCERAGTSAASNGINVYKSRPITQFVATPMVPQTLSISLKDIFTQSLGTKYITCRLNKDSAFIAGDNQINNVWTGYIQVVTADRFDIAMERAVEPIKKNLDAPEITSAQGGAETLRAFIFKKVMDVLVPLIIVIGILSAILGFYKMFFSTDDSATQEGVKYIGFGLIGIVIIMSAKFIGTTMFTMLTQPEISGSVIAQGVYNDLVYPFIKLAMFLVLGIMFIVLVGRVLTFLFGSSDDAKKKAGTIIGRNVIAMLVIIGAQQIVEVIYGAKDKIIQPISNLGDIGSGALASRAVPLLYTVVNRVMGLTSFIVLIIIIFQTVQLLMKPDSPEQMKSLKNSLLYVFIGLMVIGTGYLITNFLIIN